MKNKKNISIIIFIMIVCAILGLIFFNMNKENKYKNNKELVKFKDDYLKGTFYYNQDLKTEGVNYAGLKLNSGKIMFQKDSPITTISYNVAPKNDTEENIIQEYIDANENEDIQYKNKEKIKISKIKPIEATKIEFENEYEGISLTYMIFDDENVYWFNYVTAKNLTEIEEFKTMLDSFVIE